MRRVKIVNVPKDKKIFKRTALRVNKVNLVNRVARGGTRL